MIVDLFVDLVNLDCLVNGASSAFDIFEVLKKNSKIVRIFLHKNLCIK